MTRVGLLCLPLTGHLNPMLALGRRLQSRGHDIVFIGIPDTEEAVRTAGLTFIPISQRDCPPGWVREHWDDGSERRGLDVLRHTVPLLISLVRSFLEELPDILRQHDVGALLIDMVLRGVELVPMKLDLPYIQIANALHNDRTGRTPPIYVTDVYDTSPEARSRYLDTLQTIGAFLAPIRELGMAYAHDARLSIDWSDPYATTSRLAVITQTPRVFDFPIDDALPPAFHYTGPFTDPTARAREAFDWDRLTGEVLIYASFGTLVNRQPTLARIVLEAASRLPGTRFVFSTGRHVDPATLGPAPANVILERTPPQLELLRRASLCITHAGLNTVLESLVAGVPMVAIPIGYDQPGIAARIAHHRVGTFIEPENLNADRLAGAIQDILHDPATNKRAASMGREIAASDGLNAAARIVEAAFDLRPAVVIDWEARKARFAVGRASFDGSVRA